MLSLGAEVGNLVPLVPTKCIRLLALSVSIFIVKTCRRQSGNGESLTLMAEQATTPYHIWRLGQSCRFDGVLLLLYKKKSVLERT